jgi:hypothetical protein
LYKALKRLEIEGDTVAQHFEERVAAVTAEFKLVVKGTFIEVLEEDVASEVPLPVPFFHTTLEIDQWRKDYRRFRLGYHRGAKGEVMSKTSHAESQQLDLRSAAVCKFGPLAALPA